MLTLAIPTRNRSIYIDELLDRISKWWPDDFRLIILDNSDDKKTLEIFKKWRSKYPINSLIYVEPDSSKNVTDNFFGLYDVGGLSYA
jgi:glycosyltransferase involved in cell wall biosynthesis